MAILGKTPTPPKPIPRTNSRRLISAKDAEPEKK